jgi:hypothetical protein
MHNNFSFSVSLQWCEMYVIRKDWWF